MKNLLVLAMISFAKLTYQESLCRGDVPSYAIPLLFMDSTV